MKNKNIIISVLLLLIAVIAILSNIPDYGIDDNVTVKASGYDGLNLSSYPVKDPSYYENNTEVFLTKVKNTDFTVVRGYAYPIKLNVPGNIVFAQISFKNLPSNIPDEYTLCRAELWHMAVPKDSGKNPLEIVYTESNGRNVIVNMTAVGKNNSQSSLPVLDMLSKRDKENLSFY